MADEAIVRLAACSEALMKVVPPRFSCSGKRRPRPGGVRNAVKSPPRSPEVSGVHAVTDASALEQEVVKLRGLVTKYQQSEQQRLSLQTGQQQQHKCAVDVEVQTQSSLTPNSAGDPPVGEAAKTCDNTVDTCEAQRMQLDSLHQEVGDKSRELRRSQDTVRLLRSELKQQYEVSEQYRLQAEMLEEQLSRSNQRTRELEAKLAEAAQMSRHKDSERPFSAQLPRSWKEHSRSGFSSDEDGEANERPGTRNLRGFCS